MKPAQIDRLNALARKARVAPLTEEEAAEQAALRQAYVQAVKQNLRAQLQSISIVEEDGRRTPVQRKSSESANDDE